MSILCRIGLHKWGKVNSQHQFSSNVIDYQQVCMSCRKVKRWNRTVD